MTRGPIIARSSEVSPLVSVIHRYGDDHWHGDMNELGRFLAHRMKHVARAMRVIYVGSKGVTNDRTGSDDAIGID